MMFEFECQNLVFNPALGRSELCRNRIIASDTKVGEKVICPSCSEPTEVPFEQPKKISTPANAKIPSLASTNSQSNRAATKSTRTTAPTPAPTSAPTSAKTPRQKQATKASTDGKKNAAAAPSTQSVSGNEYELQALQSRSKVDLSAIFANSDQQSAVPLPIDRRPKCKMCGEIQDPRGRCTVCQHVEPKYEKATQAIAEIRMGLAGFQLWFVETMSESIPFRALEYGTHATVAFLATLFSVLAFVSVPLPGKLALLGLIGAFAAAYVGLVWKGHRLVTDPTARLSWFQRPFWNLVLFFARRGNWQNYDQRFEGRVIIDQRGEGLTDEHLLELENLKLCEVLDLERTSISDQGLRHLYGLPNLHCVVVRKNTCFVGRCFSLATDQPTPLDLGLIDV